MLSLGKIPVDFALLDVNDFKSFKDGFENLVRLKKEFEEESSKLQTREALLSEEVADWKKNYSVLENRSKDTANKSVDEKPKQRQASAPAPVESPQAVIEDDQDHSVNSNGSRDKPVLSVLLAGARKQLEKQKRQLREANAKLGDTNKKLVEATE
jgi:hypothetical protein